jgi:hypothetical protein
VRLGTFLLIGAAWTASSLAAQGRQPLPWEHQLPLDWQAGPESPRPAAAVPLEASSGSVTASVTGDGTLQVRDGLGIIRLQTGLPGRPLKAWRDGGLPLPAASGAWSFPTDTPMAQGLGGLRWCADDFRPFLKGLLWVLEDGEAFLTVVHPATAKAVHLPLPPGRDLRLRFLPDRLEVVAGDVDQGAPRSWSLPWMGLLPRLVPLGTHADPSKAGTALAPFPKD